MDLLSFVYLENFVVFRPADGGGGGGGAGGGM